MLSTMHDYTRHSWLLGAEAFITVASYSPEVASYLRKEAENMGLRLIMEKIELSYQYFFGKMPESHIDFFENLQPYYRSDDAIFVHAGFDIEHGTLENQDLRNFTWGCDGFPERYSGADKVVYGHWGDYDVDRTGWPIPRISENGTYGIDTSSSGVLTAVRLPDGRIYQSGRFETRGDCA